MSEGMIDGLSNRYPEKTFYLGQIFNNTTNSYKLVWFLAILSLLRRQAESSLPLADILTEMAAMAWHPVCFFRLSLGRQDKLKDAILHIFNESLLPRDAEPDRIRRFVTASSETQGRLNFFKRYVPTRFLSPWFADDLRNASDSDREKRVSILAKESQKGPLANIYWIDGGVIRINASWRNFLIENMAVVRAFAEHHFAWYLQSRNPHVPGIVNKISAATERDLRLAREFWSFVRDTFHKSGKGDRFRDIYSERPLSDRFAIDHFLPWSFVTHDLMWNLIPVETSTNSSKGDILPDLDTYLPRLVSLHAGAIQIAKERPKLLEDYTESFRLDVPGGCTKRLGEGFFVTQVVGKSMEPTIRDGSYCVFRAGVSGTRESCVLLVEKRDFTDPETGGGYTVKRYHSTKSTAEDGWQHDQIRLIPDNPDRTRFPVLEFSPEDDAELRVVAEFVQTLEPPASSTP